MLPLDSLSTQAAAGSGPGTVTVSAPRPVNYQGPLPAGQLQVTVSRDGILPGAAARRPGPAPGRGPPTAGLEVSRLFRWLARGHVICNVWKPRETGTNGITAAAGAANGPGSRRAPRPAAVSVGENGIENL